MIHPHSIRRSHCKRQGFTILESVIAITLLAIAGSMVFSVTFPAINQSFEGRDRLIARQYANSVLDEILQLPNHSETTVVALTPAIYQARDTFPSIDQFDGYVSHMCLPDGTPYTGLIPQTPIAGFEELCFRVQVKSVDRNLDASGDAEFLKITVTAFRDPEKNLQEDGRPNLIELTRLVAEQL